MCHILSLSSVRGVKSETQPRDRKMERKKNVRKVVISMTERADVLTEVGQQKQSEKGHFIYECSYLCLV